MKPHQLCQLLRYNQFDKTFDNRDLISLKLSLFIFPIQQKQMRISIALIIGEKREDGGQNHCTPTIGFTFRKSEFSDQSFLLFCFTFLNSIMFRLHRDNFYSNFMKAYDCFLYYYYMQTDTASVLSEAIEYIKFLHEQVSVSSMNIQ